MLSRSHALQVLHDVSSAPRITAAPDTAAAPRPQAPPTAAAGGRDQAAHQPDAEAGGDAGRSTGAAADQASAGPAGDGQDDDCEEELRSTPVDVVASLNFSLCLLHTRELAMRYLRLSRAAMDLQNGSIMVSSLPSACAHHLDLHSKGVLKISGW